jgi:hypothetical protein
MRRSLTTGERWVRRVALARARTIQSARQICMRHRAGSDETYLDAPPKISGLIKSPSKKNGFTLNELGVSGGAA